jgi:hypothetical protein
VRLNHVASHDQVADMFTKPLPTVLLDKCKMAVGMKDGRDLSLREEFVENKLKKKLTDFKTVLNEELKGQF